MGTGVYANGRGVASGTSGGQSVVFPDVCKTPTPGGPAPVPYPNLGRSADASKGPKSVRIAGATPMVKGAQYSRTSGDEAGTLGGAISGSSMGPAEFTAYSFDVRFEGRNVCRLGDPMFHNKRNAAG